MSVKEKIKAGFKPSPVGPIPSDWQIKELRELVDEKRTIRYGIVQPGNFDNDGRYMVRGQDYSFGWVKPDQLFKVSEQIEVKYKNARLKSGDIILTIVGAGTGTVAIVPDWLEGANITQTTARIAIDSQKALSLFCYYFLDSSQGKKLTYQNIKGGAQPGLNCGDIELYELPLPSIFEQRAIVACLSKWDIAVQRTTQLITQKEIQKKRLIEKLLSGKKRLKGFKEKWNEVRLGDVTKKISRRNTELVDAKVYSVTNSNGFVLQSEHFSREIAGDNLSNHKIVKRNEFAYNPARINVGSIAYFQNEIGIISSLYVLFSTKKDIYADYLIQWLQLDHTKHKIIRYGEGGVRIYLWYELFANIKISLPSIDEQKAIIKVLNAADTEISILKNKLEKLKEQKKGLMQILLTGKKRIKTK